MALESSSDQLPYGDFTEEDLQITARNRTRYESLQDEADMCRNSGDAFGASLAAFHAVLYAVTFQEGPEAEMLTGYASHMAEIALEDMGIAESKPRMPEIQLPLFLENLRTYIWKAQKADGIVTAAEGLMYGLTAEGYQQQSEKPYHSTFRRRSDLYTASALLEESLAYDEYGFAQAQVIRDFVKSACDMAIIDEYLGATRRISLLKVALQAAKYHVVDVHNQPQQAALDSYDTILQAAKTIRSKKLEPIISEAAAQILRIK